MACAANADKVLTSSESMFYVMEKRKKREKLLINMCLAQRKMHDTQHHLHHQQHHCRRRHHHQKQHWIYHICLGVFLLQFIVVRSAILDSRCYLDGGGSAESFLAREDLELGAIIGKLRINGDADAENGDITLSLREKDAPVEIVPGTKELALAVELDKEGLEGPSSIYVNVICVRRHSTDPSFVIPVNVRVTDVNDNEPQWIGTPYTLTLSEVTVPGTRILQGAHAEDADQPGPFSTVEYQVLPGPYAEYVQFLNPLDGTLVLKKPLDYETMQNFTVKLRAQDQGIPPKYADTLLRVVITDADDQNPKFSRETYSGELPADGRPGEVRIRPEPIKAVDQDEGICAPIQYTIVQSQDAKYFRVHPHNGVITLLTPLGPTDLVSGGATLVVKATQIDNTDRYALTTVALTRPGARNELAASLALLAFVQKRFSMRIREDTAVGNRILGLPTNKPGKHLKYTIADPVNAEYFSVGTLGEVVLIKALDYEKMTRHDFQVFASDGTTNATADITIEVIDVNDWEPRFRETHYEFIVPKSSMVQQSESLEGVMVGKVEAADGDRNDKLELSLRGQHAGLFEIDSLSGNIYMRPEQLKQLNDSKVHLIAVATDSGEPPRSTSVPVTVTMEGVALAHAPWSGSLLSMFGVLVGVFMLIIVALSCYIVHYKRKSRKTTPTGGLNRSRHTADGSLMTHEKVITGNGNGAAVTSSGGVSVLHMKHHHHHAMSNPMTSGSLNATTNGLHLHNHHHHHPANAGGGGGGGGVSLANSMAQMGATTVLAASLEREAQRERERERQRESYAATVRSIVSRASANGQLFEEDEIEPDDDALLQPAHTPPHDNNNKKTAWEPKTNSGHSITHANGSSVTTIATVNGGSAAIALNSNGAGTGEGSNLVTATDTMGSSENNLTVYF